MPTGNGAVEAETSAGKGDLGSLLGSAPTGGQRPAPTLKPMFAFPTSPALAPAGAGGTAAVCVSGGGVTAAAPPFTPMRELAEDPPDSPFSPLSCANS
jgi:hypothetical protein